MASIKPIDEASIIKASNETGLIITVEEHNIIGGLGSAVSEVVSEKGNAKLIRLGINDQFCDTVGTPDYLFKNIKLTSDNIVSNIRNFCKK